MSMTPSRIETTPMSTKIQLIGHAEVLTDSTHNKDVVVLAVGTYTFYMPECMPQSFATADTHYMYVQLLQMHSCYDVLAISNRLVALDINLPLNKAFYALVFNSMLLSCNGLLQTFATRSVTLLCRRAHGAAVGSIDGALRRLH